MKCKPGDLAIVVNSNQANVGLSLTVQCLEDPPFGAPEHKGKIWRVDRNIHWFASATGQRVYVGPYIEDHCLMPITPPDDMTEDTDEREFIEKTY